ncbi:MAG: type II toxin-antitoxin system HicA family toxin [Candidatus Liptonbacteria bacterium]|nr:type II toxin-antitoxin system HicA family toxin [Candidatus Liptonbacteria bacterium]
MPKLPVINDRQLMQALRRLGFLEHPEHGSSHLVFKHPDGRRTVVARHAGKDIPAAPCAPFSGTSISRWKILRKRWSS